MKLTSFALALPVIVLLAGCSSDSDKTSDDTTPSMESIPNPYGAPSQAQNNQDSHGWGENVQAATGGRQ